jgi:hypothetical protein
MRKGTSTIESWMMVNGKDGDHFYTHKKDKDITAIASYYTRKVHTERLIIIDGHKDKPSAYSLTRVTLLPIKKH